MEVPAKLAAFGVVLALSLAGGAALGAAVGPIDVDGSPSHTEPMTPATSVPSHEEGH
jgi:hypothetical protein